MYLEECGHGWFVSTKMAFTLVEAPSLLTNLFLPLPNASPSKSLLLLTATANCYCSPYQCNKLIFCPHSPNPDANEWSVFVGPQLVDGLEVFQSSVGVDRIVVSTLPGINIALLKLAELVTSEDYIQPVCMDIDNTRSFPAGTPCLVAGWEMESASTGKVSSMI